MVSKDFNKFVLKNESEHFPEAFNRYEETIKTKGISDFQTLLTSFRLWSNEKYIRFINSKKQVKSLAVEGYKRLGINPIYLDKMVDEKNRKIIYRYRNVLTGRFEKGV